MRRDLRSALFVSRSSFRASRCALHVALFSACSSYRTPLRRARPAAHFAYTLTRSPRRRFTTRSPHRAVRAALSVPPCSRRAVCVALFVPPCPRSAPRTALLQRERVAQHTSRASRRGLRGARLETRSPRRRPVFTFGAYKFPKSQKPSQFKGVISKNRKKPLRF